VRLTIKTALWRSHVARIAGSVDGLVPVVKGNGYGFGRRWLAATAAEFADTIAVGTVHELADVPTGVLAVVLTPTLTPPATTEAMLTVGNREHVEALAGWQGRVLVKLASSMQRYGRTSELIDTARAAGLTVAGVSIHPPLAGSADDHATEIVKLMDDIDPATEVWVSHLDPATFAELPTTHRFRLRLGTMLWLGDKSMLQLTADVLDVRQVRRGDVAGYRLVEIDTDGHLVMIGAGSAHGVRALDDGRSPFHFQHTRLALLEPPHMHTSMCAVASHAPCPVVGDRVDVQRPLTLTAVDEYEWL
jgi:alanine racemase